MENNQNWKEELNKLAEILSQTPLIKTIKWGADVYTYNGKNVVTYLGFKSFFSLWFYNGVFLKDEFNVLIRASEGKTKSQRQWRFSSMEEIDEKKVLQYVYEAIEIEKSGLRIAPEKFKPIPMPSIFDDFLAKNEALRTCFEKLTPGKQKEYILHILDAKQENTRLKRLNTIAPLILSGRGLNDKYK